jgi:branched-chain amino acid transport system substrate-binding protein
MAIEEAKRCVEGLGLIGFKFQPLSQKFRPNDAVGTFSVHGWATGLIMQEALLNAGPCITSDTIKASLEKMKNFDPSGLTGAVTFTRTNHLGNISVILQKVEGGKWVTVGKFIK